jgi:ribosomal 50S subunit-associated protein YjgA (DUF615 family)
MAGVKGRSGRKDKDFAEAIRLAANTEDAATRKRKLRLIAEKVVDLALAGESWAVQTVADRLDGKPAQEQSVTIDDRRDLIDYTDVELTELLRSSTEANKVASH